MSPLLIGSGDVDEGAVAEVDSGMQLTDLGAVERWHGTMPQNLRPTRSGSNSKYNQRHQRVGRRDQGTPATTAGARSASGAQPFPFANRAGCSDAADWQCNPAGAGRGFIQIVHFISQFPIPNSQFPIPNSQFPIPNSQFPFPISLFHFPLSGFMDRPLPPPRSVP